MDIKEIKSDVLFKKYKIVTSKKDVDAAIEDKAQELVKTANIPGFRVGKVPLDIIKDRYKDNIKSDLVNDFINSAVDKLVAENKFDLATRPSIDSVDFKDDGELVFEASFELLPKMPALDFSKIKLIKHVAKASEADVDEALENLRNQNKQLNSIGADISIEKDHVAHIDAIGFMDGKEFPEGKVKDYNLKIGSGQFIPGFEDGLIGSRVGEEKTLNLKFPADYHVSKYASKDVSFVVKIKEVFKEDLPLLDDEFAQKFNLKNLSELREAAKKSSEEKLEQFSRTILKKELFDTLNRDIEIELPAKMLQDELEFVSKSTEENAEKSDKNKHKELAQRRIKLGLFINDLAKKENITLTQEDISNEVMAQIKAYPEAASFLVKYYKENPQALDSLRGKALEDKAVEFILAKISVEEKNVTAEELKALYGKTS
jgi:trigger factor